MPDTCPNKYPTAAFNGVAIIGEAPGEHEVKYQEPFVGKSGMLLNEALHQAGINRDSCFIGNICQHRPPYNDIARFNPEGPEITQGKSALYRDLDALKPHRILLLGGTPLYHMAGLGQPLSRRGTFVNNTMFTTLHPAYVLRNSKVEWVWKADIRKFGTALDPKWELPQRTLLTSMTHYQLIEAMDSIPAGSVVGFDIEGSPQVGMTGCSIALSPTHCFMVPILNQKYQPVWDEVELPPLMEALQRFVENPNVGKVLHNALYDSFVLEWCYGWKLNPVVGDTMLQWWEYNPEAEKKLGFVASMLTYEPYWKDTRTSESDDEAWKYCCIDSAVTLEINQTLNGLLPPAAATHYQFNLELLPAFRHMMQRGMVYDAAKGEELRAQLLHEFYVTLGQLNREAGTLPDVPTLMADLHIKRLQKQEDPMPLMFTEKWLRKDYHPAIEDLKLLYSYWLLGEFAPDEVWGKVCHLCKVGLNVNSNPQVCDYLYNKKGYTPVYKVENGRRTTKPTADTAALLSLVKRTSVWKKKSNHDLHLILKLRSLDTQQEILNTTVGTDGRIRCSYNPVGTDTGRVSCSSSSTGQGYNLQTTPKPFRVLFRPDPDHWFFQCDLNGADGWTVAAWAKARGDSTMWDDYTFGIKPAKVLALMYREGPHVNDLSREELLVLSASVADDWLYAANKMVQHGTSYNMGPNTMANQIMLQAYKKKGEAVYVEPKTCSELQELFFLRYPGVKLWQQMVERQLRRNRQLTSASGHTRRFLAKYVDPSVVGTALSNEPQENTTYATNLAMHRLWHDPENWEGGKPLVEPLHSVHDALCGQFHKSRTEWAVAKLREWFNNTLCIGGVEVVIPFEGEYGDSWGNMKEGKI